MRVLNLCIGVTAESGGYKEHNFKEMIKWDDYQRLGVKFISMQEMIKWDDYQQLGSLVHLDALSLRRGK